MQTSILVDFKTNRRGALLYYMEGSKFFNLIECVDLFTNKKYFITCNESSDFFKFTKGKEQKIFQFNITLKERAVKTRFTKTIIEVYHCPRKQNLEKTRKMYPEYFI